MHQFLDAEMLSHQLLVLDRGDSGLAALCRYQQLHFRLLVSEPIFPDVHTLF